MVVFFSATGTTKGVAEQIAAAANAGSGNWLEGARLSASSDIAGWVSSFN